MGTIDLFVSVVKSGRARFARAVMARAPSVARVGRLAPLAGKGRVRFARGKGRLASLAGRGRIAYICRWVYRLSIPAHSDSGLETGFQDRNPAEEKK
jgi:hypothetical protein